MDDPAYRYLRGYSLDPGFSTRLETASINEAIYRIPFEPLKPGPVGEYIEVVDFDPASNCWYDPVDLSDERVASQFGLAPSEGNPQFHQQLVYAVAMKNIKHFERALGRLIVWYPRGEDHPKHKGNSDTRKKRSYVGQLRLHPHAMREANAYYDPDRKAVLFGYFSAANQFEGANYPGGLVFTCLSPDIVAHEMTHAILDSIHHRYLEDTNVDVAAFHEGFADIVALLQRFTFGELVEDQLYRSAGRLDGETSLGALATQFGEALAGNRGALRSMIGTWNKKGQWKVRTPKPSDYMSTLEPHARGAVLVATVFDAFQRVYKHSTTDLIRIATGGTGVLPQGSISRDLVHRLAGEAQAIAGHLLHICIRALDYCPPHDISFGDYLRALITADIDIAPEDEAGYRVALIEAFRARGIFPDRVNTLSIESLSWSSPGFTKTQDKVIEKIAERIKPSVRSLVETKDRKKLYERSVEACAELETFLTNDAGKFNRGDWEKFLNKLGLTSKPVAEIFDKDPEIDKLFNGRPTPFLRHGRPNNAYVPNIEVQSLRPAYRAGREEGREIEQVVVTLTQRLSVQIGDRKTPREMVFRGGCSIILDLGELTCVKYVVSKNIRSNNRFVRQVKYLRGESEAAPPSTSLYSDDDRNWRLNFNLLHQH